MQVWIYLIRDRTTGYFKIGRAKDVHYRFKQLVKQDTLLPYPNDFELVDAWLGAPSDESNLHLHYAEERRRGEWFELENIEGVKAYFHNHRSLSGSSEQQRKEDRIKQMLDASYEDEGSALDFAVEGWGYSF